LERGVGGKKFRCHRLGYRGKEKKRESEEVPCMVVVEKGVETFLLKWSMWNPKAPKPIEREGIGKRGRKKKAEH